MEIKVIKQVLEWNEDCSEEIKRILKEKKIFMINVMGSPGAGKTTFIKKFIENVPYKVGVIEGDIASKIDAEKISALNVPVIQLNTDGACHIEAMSIKNVLPEFKLDELDILIVENIGNLVCPAEFNLGEDLRIVILSIPEGDDKVEKYPLMFTKADVLVLNKYDVKQYFDFNESRVIESIESVNRKIKVFNMDSQSGEGIERVVDCVKEFLEYKEANIYR